LLYNFPKCSSFQQLPSEPHKSLLRHQKHLLKAKKPRLAAHYQSNVTKLEELLVSFGQFTALKVLVFRLKECLWKKPQECWLCLVGLKFLYLKGKAITNRLWVTLCSWPSKLSRFGERLEVLKREPERQLVLMFQVFW